ncbi:MAG: sulfotransferase domain-containing protein [Lentisphaerae bacterium]|nr:sulfotransferase domain-containing protein [Lentisphaerota bacterium]
MSNLIQRAVNKAKRKTFSRIYFDVDHDHENTIFLAGNGRSGSTWVGDIINYRNEYRVLFEPFHPRHVPLCKSFRYRQYLRPENREEKYLAPARAILTGRVRDQWVDRANRKFISRKRIVKEIRANHMLKWLKVNFPGLRIIMLFRHPCAVANSRMKMGWENHMDSFLEQPELMEDHLEPFRAEIERASTDFERHIFQWCIENYVPLRQLSEGDVHLAFYERFCEAPGEEVERMFTFLNLECDKRIFSWLGLGIPSVTTRAGSPVRSGKSLTSGWRREFDAAHVQRAIDILSLFGLDRIYTGELMPNIDGACSMLRETTALSDGLHTTVLPAHSPRLHQPNLRSGLSGS